MTRAAITLDELNALDEPGFVKALDGIFEHAPWVAAGAVRSRPFATVSGLHDGLMRVVRQKPRRQNSLPSSTRHPVLGGKEREGRRRHRRVGQGAGGHRRCVARRRRGARARGAKRQLPGEVRLPVHHLRPTPYATIDPSRTAGADGEQRRSGGCQQSGRDRAHHAPAPGRSRNGSRHAARVRPPVHPRARHPRRAAGAGCQDRAFRMRPRRRRSGSPRPRRMPRGGPISRF